MIIRDKYQLLPPLKDSEYESLKEDIQKNGVLVPIVFDEEGNVLDGHHRMRICEELGIEYPSIVKEDMSENEKRTFARSVNVHRRHLTSGQRRSLIVDELTENPTLPNLQIALRLGVSDHTVAKIRKALGLDGKVVGADGKEYTTTHKDRMVGERLVYTVVFKDADDYQKWMLLIRQARIANKDKLISESLIDLIELGVACQKEEVHDTLC